MLAAVEEVAGIDDHFSLPHEEMYGEHFDIPAPDELVLVIRGLAEFLKGDVRREPPVSEEKDARSLAGNETGDHAFP